MRLLALAAVAAALASGPACAQDEPLMLYFHNDRVGASMSVQRDGLRLRLGRETARCRRPDGELTIAVDELVEEEGEIIRTGLPLSTLVVRFVKENGGLDAWVTKGYVYSTPPEVLADKSVFRLTFSCRTTQPTAP